MKRQCVVLIEDNPDDHILVERVFSKLNIKLDIISFYDGDSALQWLRRPDRAPDLVLVDHKLPTISGTKIVEECKRYPMYQGVPFILMTDSTPDGVLAEAYDAGVYSCIKKPDSDPLGWGQHVKIAAHYWLTIHKKMDKPLTPELQAEVREVRASSIDIIDPFNQFSKRRY